MIRKVSVSIAIAGWMLMVASAHAGDRAGCRKLCKERGVVSLDLTADQLAAETVKGPVRLELSNVNRLRYEVKIGSTVTLTPGPDISPFLFVPAVPSATTPPATPTPTPTPAPMTEGVQEETPVEKVQDRIDAISTALKTQGAEVNKLLAQARTSLAILATQLGDVERLVRESDATLDSGGETALAALVKTTEKKVGKALPGITWPSGDSIRSARSAITGLAGELAELPLVEPGFSEWSQDGNNRDLFRGLQAFAKQLLANLDTLEASSEQRKGFDKQLDNLVTWHGILIRNLDSGSFHETIPVPCGYPFVESKRTQFKVVKADRLETDKTKVTREAILVTVDCPTSVTVTGGIGVSGVDETDIKLISAPSDDSNNATTVTKIGFENRGKRQVNPLFLLNTRITNWQAFNLHVTAGTVLDLDNPSSNVALGYVFGPSLSIRDNIYLSSGIQWERVAKLTGGAKEGQIVPEGLAKPPIERRWDSSWFFAVTYKIR